MDPATIMTVTAVARAPLLIKRPCVSPNAAVSRRPKPRRDWPGELTLRPGRRARRARVTVARSRSLVRSDGPGPPDRTVGQLEVTELVTGWSVSNDSPVWIKKPNHRTSTLQKEPFVQQTFSGSEMQQQQRQLFSAGSSTLQRRAPQFSQRTSNQSLSANVQQKQQPAAPQSTAQILENLNSYVVSQQQQHETSEQLKRQNRKQLEIIEQQKRDLEQLKYERTSIAEKLRQHEAVVEGLEISAKSFTDNFEINQKNVLDAKKKLDFGEKKYDSFIDWKSKLDERIAQIEDSYHSKHQLLVEQLANANKDKVSLDKIIHEQRLEIQALSKQNAQMQADMKEKISTIDDLRSKYADVTARFNALLEERNNLKTEATREKDEKVLMQKTLDDTKSKILESEMCLRTVQKQLADKIEMHSESQKQMEKHFESKMLEMREISQTEKQTYNKEIEMMKSTKESQEKELEHAKQQCAKLSDLLNKALSHNKGFQQEFLVIENMVSCFENFDDTLGKAFLCTKLRFEKVSVEKQRLSDVHAKILSYLHGQENDMNILDQMMLSLDSMLSDAIIQKHSQSNALLDLSSQVSFLQKQIAEKDNEHRNKMMSNLKEMEDHLKKVMQEVKRDHEMEMKAQSEEHNKKVQELETQLAHSQSYQEKYLLQSMEHKKTLQESFSTKSFIQQIRDSENTLERDVEPMTRTGHSTPSKQLKKSWNSTQKLSSSETTSGALCDEINPILNSNCERSLSTPERQVPVQDLTPATTAKGTHKRRRGFLDVSKKNLKEDISNEMVAQRVPISSNAVLSKPKKAAPISRRYTRKRNNAAERHSSGSQDSFNIFDNDS
eukprot:768680-Hanusia_phi.AAC.3